MDHLDHKKFIAFLVLILVVHISLEIAWRLSYQDRACFFPNSQLLVGIDYRPSKNMTYIV